MKSQMCESQLFSKNGVLGGVKHDGKIIKQKDTSEEMQLYLNKLKDLVPFMPRNKRVSKLEIIQNVIDYICDLQVALESHPAARHSTTIPMILCSNTSPIRQPLGVNTVQNTPLASTCAAQEASQQEKHTTHLEEINSRPVSC